MQRRIVLTLTAVVAAAGALVAPALPASAATSSGKCTPTLAAGLTTVHVTSGGVDRTAEVYIPAKVAKSKGRAALVLTLHGSVSTGAQQLQRSGLTGTADAKGFVVAAPTGLIPAGTVPGVGPTYRWNVPYVTLPPGTTGPDDQQFLLDLIDALAVSACIDDRRVIASGYSGGGRMVSALACDHPDRVAAIAPVAGLRFGPPLADGAGGFVPDLSRCAPGRPVPVITFAGTADPVNPYSGGGLPYWGYGTLEATAAWATNNGCRPTPVTTQVSPSVTRLAYKGCKANADVVLYTVTGGGHTWPGVDLDWGPLGAVTLEINASNLLWEFGRNRVACS